MKLVIIESPYAGNVELNVTYARACMRDSILRGEAPFASHLLYTQEGILDDTIPAERELGIALCLDGWAKHASLTAVYTNLGISRGMQYGLDLASKAGRTIEYRELRYDIHGNWIVGP